MGVMCPSLTRTCWLSRIRSTDDEMDDADHTALQQQLGAFGHSALPQTGSLLIAPSLPAWLLTPQPMWWTAGATSSMTWPRLTSRFVR
jgi:hypothetical protein